MSNPNRLMILATLAMLAAVPAKADTLKFYNGGAGYGGPFNGPGTVYAATSGLPTDCPAGFSGCGGTDIVQNPQVFLGGSVTVTGGPAPNVALNDLQPPFAGMGVGTNVDPNIDQINGTDVLHIHFSSAVTITGIGTLFDPNHAPFGTFDPATVGSATFLINGQPFTFGDANTIGKLALFGTDFDFAENGPNQPQFYVGALTFNQVPIPGAVWLFASGLAGLGALARRRKNQSAIAA